MPIDPNIALGIKPPEFQSPLQQYSNVLSLKGLLQGQQLQQQQIQGATLENQQRQLSVRDQQTMRQLYMDSEGDPIKFQKALTKSSVDPVTQLQIGEKLTEMRQKVANLDKTTRENDAAAMDTARGKGLAVTSEPDLTKKENSWNQFVQDSMVKGIPGAQDFPATYPGDDHAKLLLNSLATGSQLRKEANEQEGAAARTLAAQTGAARLTKELPGIEARNVVAEQEASQTPEQRALIPNTPENIAIRAGQGDTAAINAQKQIAAAAAEKAAGEERAKQQVQQEQFGGALEGTSSPANLDPVTGRDETFFKGLNPTVANQVKLLVEGKIAPPSSFALRSSSGGPSYWGNILALAARYDPSFDTVNWNKRLKTAQAFSGSSINSPGGQVNAANTTLEHLNGISRLVDQMGNFGGLATPLNYIRNPIRTKFGSTAVTNFETGIEQPIKEIERLYLGSRGSQQDIDKLREGLSSAKSPAQHKGALGVFAGQIEDKIGELQRQYDEGMGTATHPLLTSDNQKILSKLKGEGSGLPFSAAKPTYKVGDTVNYQGKPHKITEVKPDGKLVLENNE